MSRAWPYRLRGPRRSGRPRPLRLASLLGVAGMALAVWMTENPARSVVAPIPDQPGAETSGRSCQISVPSLPLPGPANVQGVARVIDGDTLAIGPERIRLNGINAAEIDTPAGRQAKTALDAVIAGRPVACMAMDQPDRYGRMVARCVVGTGIDLGAAMLAAGQARAWPHFLKNQPHRADYLALDQAFSGRCSMPGREGSLR